MEDTTYGTNEFNMSYYKSVVLNENKKVLKIENALISKETKDYYKWIH